MLDQCSPQSLLATEDLVLDDVVLLAIRKQAFRESEKRIRGCQASAYGRARLKLLKLELLRDLINSITTSSLDFSVVD